MCCMQEKYQGFDFCMEEKDGLYLIKVFDEKGRKIGRCKGNLLDARLNGATIKAMALGAVNVEPEYRRCGIARHCFAMLGRIIEEKNCPVSYLHPFSFPYYRTIGYERVADHRVIEFPIEKLDFIPRHAALERVLPENGTKELEQIYNEFCMERNAIFLRHGTLPTTEPTICEGYTNGGPFTYNFRDPVYYLTRDENGRPDGYLMLRREMIQEHHHLFGTVHIDEICFTSPAAMRRLLGFIRMYDGEVDTVVFHNTGMAPEVEQTLRDYKYIKLQSVPDLCARFHDVPAVLSAMKYPKSAGEFTLRVTDCEKSPFSKKKTEGIWKVAYENEKAIVTELPADSPCDLELEMPALAQLIHGFQSYGRQSAIYTEGVTLHGDCEDFFRAFPNRPCGMYDLF